jgi:hypothetical protein
VPSIDEESYRARWGLFTLFHSIFHALPRSIISENGLFAAHASFPMHGPLAELFDEQVLVITDPSRYRAALAREIFDGEHARASTDNLTWNDLDADLGGDGVFVPISDQRRQSDSGGGLFSPLDFERFCRGTGTSLMIRGHQSTGPKGASVPQVVKAFYEREGLRHPEVWTLGGVVTVESRATWSALLDLSIPQPTPTDVEWIGLVRKGSLQGAGTHENGRLLPLGPAKSFLMRLPPL